MDHNFRGDRAARAPTRFVLVTIVCVCPRMHTSHYQPLTGARHLILSYGVLHILLYKRADMPPSPQFLYKFFFIVSAQLRQYNFTVLHRIIVESVLAQRQQHILIAAPVIEMHPLARASKVQRQLGPSITQWSLASAQSLQGLQSLDIL